MRELARTSVPCAHWPFGETPAASGSVSSFLSSISFTYCRPERTFTSHSWPIPLRLFESRITSNNASDAGRNSGTREASHAAISSGQRSFSGRSSDSPGLRAGVISFRTAPAVSRSFAAIDISTSIAYRACLSCGVVSGTFSTAATNSGSLPSSFASATSSIAGAIRSPPERVRRATVFSSVPSPRRGGLGRGAACCWTPAAPSPPLPGPPRRGEGGRVESVGLDETFPPFTPACLPPSCNSGPAEIFVGEAAN